ncbi:MAG TPA: response regulator transcription factor [Planctomycetota bacterium]|nr:response regulator transcription factor [Planctomycetota bacterium]
MAKSKILVIEDDNDIRELIRHNLTREGYDVSGTAEGEKGLKLVETNHYDMVILDLMLPGMHGLEVCRRIRANANLRRTGILIVTAKDEEADIVTGLELGADDYLVKPFSIRVLLARVRAVVRRVSDLDAEADEKPFVLGALKIDATRHEVTVKGQRIDLTLAEFRILQNLARQIGRVLTRNQLLDLALGQDHFVLNRTIDVHVSSLRRKLGPCGALVETVRGVGYRLKDE